MYCFFTYCFQIYSFYILIPNIFIPNIFLGPILLPNYLGSILLPNILVPNIFLGPILLHASSSCHQLFHCASSVQGRLPGPFIMIMIGKVFLLHFFDTLLKPLLTDIDSFYFSSYQFIILFTENV